MPEKEFGMIGTQDRVWQEKEAQLQTPQMAAGMATILDKSVGTLEKFLSFWGSTLPPPLSFDDHLCGLPARTNIDRGRGDAILVWLGQPQWMVLLKKH